MLVSKYKRNKEVLVSDDDKCCFSAFSSSRNVSIATCKIHKVLGDVHHSHLLFVLFVLSYLRFILEANV